MKGNLKILNIIVLLFVIIFLFSCFHFSSKNAHYSLITDPSDNASSNEKIKLGRDLFFDKRLSLNESVSCATCHVPQYAFSDQKKVSEGIFGRHTERNSPSILNAGYLPTVMYDGHLETLEKQVIVPIQEHVEMGMDMLNLIKKLRAIPEYQSAAQSIFKRDFDPFVLSRSIACFERSLISLNSRFDQYFKGQNSTLTKEEIQGWKLFSKKLNCIKCHPAPYFTSYKVENNGLYADYSSINDKGRFRIHNDSNDIGYFKIPSLRNIELTFPYMHDGSLSTLDDVIKHYEKGGNKNKTQSHLIRSFTISDKQRKALKAFLLTLTDTTYCENFQTL